MILGFYYHIAVTNIDGEIFLPEYLGSFIDELARNVNTLYYFAFSTIYQAEDQTYRLDQKNIILIDLGKKPIFPKLVVFGGKWLKKHKSIAEMCDLILVRAPSPLAAHFYFQFKKQTKIAYFMVNDYIIGLKYQSNHWFRELFIYGFTYLNEYLQQKAVKNSICLVNSTPLKWKYEKITKNVYEVRTTTLKSTDFYARTNTCANSKSINLLFIGRIEKAKGIEELIEVFIRLRQNGFPVILNLAGLKTEEAIYYENKLIELIDNPSAFIFHGFKAGNELLTLYRNADIFVLPTHHEGFPRVIWEAMANSLPIISTTVGSIPFYIKNEVEAILIPTQDSEALYNGIKRLIADSNLRQRIIHNAFELVQDFTVEKQVKKLLLNLS